MLTILAFLQNSYFNNPTRAKEVYDRNPDIRENLNKKFLFSGCLTGRRLQDSFGWEQCDRIIWEEISREIGGAANSSFPGDQEHIRAVIEKHQPAIILVFGLLAKEALRVWSENEVNNPEPKPMPVMIYGPHPAARHANVAMELWDMAQDLIFSGGFWRGHLRALRLF
jgi:hypothetical protein